jgi:hypothetical protein
MTRQILHRLIEELPEEELTPAVRYLEFLAQRENEGPWSDSTYCDYALAQVRAAEQEILNENTVSLEDAKKLFPQCFGE